MTFLLWSLPILLIVILIMSGRVPSIGAGIYGTLAAAAIALTAAPTPLAPSEVLMAGIKGLWLCWLVGAVIFAGLFFREVTKSGNDLPEGSPSTQVLKRRKVFTACFLIGPFAEAATGYGVGQVATIAVLRTVGLAPIHMILLALFSQILVPWGAMANGTVVGAQLAGLSVDKLGLFSALLTVPLLLTWLVLFWRMTASAGLPVPRADLLQELAYVLITAALLIIANVLFGPEIAAMAAVGPVIVVRFWREDSPDREHWMSALRVGLPYALLIAGLAASRGLPMLNQWLGNMVALRPFADGPTWSPMLHPGTWLVAVGVLTAFATGRRWLVVIAARDAWSHGRMPTLTIGIYLVIAQIMADSGTAQALAEGLRQLLGPLSVLAVPLLAGALGFLTGSSNAANGLLMRSQASLADHNVPLVWIAALQNTASAALTMLSPARVAMGCALIGRMDLERSTYTRAWPLGAAALTVLTASAAMLLIAR